MNRTRFAIKVAALVACTAVVGAQTRITPPKNKYTPQQDVEIGREAAAEVRREYPIIDDRQIDSYLDGLGRRLVAAAPAELKHEVFEYSFTPVNLKDINAFALPGGPMFVNRGMFAAATTEGEVVGVMAHELSHVLLRHGTANATKAQGFQLGALAGAIAGAVIGGGVGQVISQGSQFGLGTWLLKYSREYEKQADLLGAQIMARAGYDPRDLGRMFETIAKQGNGAPPQWLSSHPNPGNRTQYIADEASKLQIGPRPSQAGFASVKSRFDTLAAREVDGRPRAGRRGGRRRPGRRGAGFRGHRGRTRAAARAAVPHGARRRSVPGERADELDGGLVEQLREVRAAERLWSARGQTVLTHGVELGVARASSRDLREATDSLVRAFVQSNPDMRQVGESVAVRMSNRSAIGTPLVGRSALGGSERVGVYTTLLADGNLFYYLTVVPEDDAPHYAAVFDRVGQSIRLTDR